MCFACDSTETIQRSGFSLRIERVHDPLTRPSDLDMSAGLLETFESGEWLFVGLRATFIREGQAEVSETLYGIPEFGNTGCALRDVGAMQAVEDRLMGSVQAMLSQESYALAAEPVSDEGE